MMPNATGPLAGLKVLEFAGLGPGPFAAMMLSDCGADVLRIDRAESGPSPHAVLERGRRSVVLDLKSDAGIATARRLAATADLLIEGFRPGVMERLGLGPDALLALNPRLVYARMTGWGQDGPLAQDAGHDPNYLALTGAVNAIGTTEEPVLPLSLVGDYGGGGMLLAFGAMSALWHARATGEGQVVDVAMIDGVMTMMSALYGSFADGKFSGERAGPGSFSAAPFTGVYRCKDGLFVTLCAFEGKFYRTLLGRLGLADDPDLKGQFDRETWPAGKAKLAAIFATRSRDEWTAFFDGLPVCLTPVLSMGEAQRHPHNVARGAFVDLEGQSVPAPSPRFSATPAAIRSGPVRPGDQAREALADWGLDDAEIAQAVAVEREASLVRDA